MKIFKFWLPPILWALVIFTFSSFQTASASKFYLGDFLIKKTAHILEYGIFASMLYRAMINSGLGKKKAMWYSVLLAFLYGATDEFHQSFTPGRGPSIRDVLIDTFGAGLFVFGLIKNMSKLPKYLKVFAKKIDLA